MIAQSRTSSPMAFRTNNQTGFQLPTDAPAPLRLVLVISNLEYGGAQRQVVELANNLDPARVDVMVCTLSPYVPLADTLIDRHNRLHVIEKRFKYDLSVVPRLARLLREHAADVVQSYLFDADIAARLAGRLASTPLIVGSERNTDYSLKHQQLLAYWLTSKTVDLIIANSHAGATFNSALLKHDTSMYRVVHNGVDTARFRPVDIADAKRAIGVGAEQPVIGMFASFKQQKNHPLFFAAARLVLDSQPAAKLLLVGDELHAGMHGSRNYKQQMEGQIDALNLRSSCLCMGNRSDVERIYPACDLTVLPSLFEGSPNVALESMACGVPVVVTDVADNRLIVPNGQAGFVVPLGDERTMAQKIATLASDPELRATMGQQARTWILQNFSSQRLAEKTEAVYRQALADRRGRAKR